MGRRMEMKCYDLVKVIKDKENYTKNNIHAGDVGRISEAWIINNCFTVAFDTGNDEDFYNFCEIKIEDLELIEEGWGSDEILLDELPKKDPHWWCKVEDGFIMNLKGDKKNKIPYDYNS